MSVELGKFMVIWFLIMAIFTCVGMLLFGGLPAFHELFDVFIIFFEAALGVWDTGIYHELNDEGERNLIIENVGVVFHMLFLLINLVLMLNLVIAILANTFNRFETLSNGLYYNVLIHIFPLYDWDDSYGIIACT